MPRKVKEEDRVEKILRGLLKEPENRRCISCNSLGPQYVCTTFYTFVCTSCSGVHREFSHRVKSVSMAKFNQEEIMSLQAGGNERARQIYFKAWDPQRNNYPDSSNLHKLREFIRQVFIERRYAGQNNYGKPSLEKADSGKLETYSRSSRDDFLERRSTEGSSNRREEIELRSIEKSSPSRKNEERSFRSYILEEKERRSPRFVPDTVRSASHRNRRIEIVDDRFRDDGNMKLYDRYTAGRESRSGSMSPVSLKIRDRNLPAIRPVKEILGNKGPVLAIAPPPKASDGKDPEGKQKVSSTESPSSASAKQKQEPPVSLIDFDANPEPTQATPEPQKETKNSKESSSAPLQTNGKAATASKNSVEDLLFGLSDPVSSPSAATSQMSAVGQPASPQVANGVGALAITVVENNQTSQTNSNDSRALVTQQWNASQPSNDPRLVTNVQTSQAAESGDGSKPSGRKELPADLFASSFTGFNQSSPGWQMRPPQGLGGYGMQYYHPSMSVPSYSHPGRPRNPFDIGDDGPQAQVAQFPLMSPLQVALPGMSAATGLQSQPSPYAAPLSPHMSPYGMSMPLVPAGAYMGQQPNNMPLTRPQGVASRQDAFSSLNPIQQSNRSESMPVPPTSSPLSRAGNPFG